MTMTRVPDRKKLRREYLKQKGFAYYHLTGKSLFFSLGVLVCIGLLQFAVYVFFVAIQDGRESSFYAEPEYYVSGLCGIMACVSAVITRSIWRGVQQAKQDLNIPNVPPLTSDTLPAEEVLVRGAEEPLAGKDTLVRPSTASEETTAEQLLRNSNGGQPG
jgi:hypothetical protein